MRVAIFITAILLTACSVPNDTRGVVVDFNGDFVTMRGAMNQVSGKPGFTPTAGMIQQASEVCGGSAIPQGTDIAPNQPTGTINYNFLCR